MRRRGKTKLNANVSCVPEHVYKYTAVVNDPLLRIRKKKKKEDIFFFTPVFVICAHMNSVFQTLFPIVIRVQNVIFITRSYPVSLQNLTLSSLL